MLMRLMSKGEYLIVPKGMKFKGSGKLGLMRSDVLSILGVKLSLVIAVLWVDHRYRREIPELLYHPM